MVGSELNCTPGKRGKRGMRGEWGKSEGTHSLQVPSPLFPFLPSIIFREFFSTALLYERLEQARTRLIFVTRPTSSILMAVDNFSGYASAVALFSHFTDMSKAFDSLHPSLMINKLKAYGFSEESLSLMRSYFSNRQIRVKLNGVTSSWKDAVRGCPQGSSFGPLLWNIFQNDMTYIVNNASLSMYADDHQLYVKGYSVDCVEQLLTLGATISKWYKDNFLKGNCDQYNLTLLGRKNKLNHHQT